MAVPVCLSVQKADEHTSPVASMSSSRCVLAQVGSPEGRLHNDLLWNIFVLAQARGPQNGLRDTEQHPLCCMCMPCPATPKCPCSVSVRSQQRAVITMLNPLEDPCPPVLFGKLEGSALWSTSVAGGTV